MTFAELIAKYHQNRKVLLFIVYIALFLDNMLLTTVVPIIPEYLLRLSHPNSTDLLLYNKAPTQLHGRGKREADGSFEPMTWNDNAWEMPLDGDETMINWEQSPLNLAKYTRIRPKPSKGSKGSRKYQPGRGGMRPATTTTESPQLDKVDKSVMEEEPTKEEARERHETLAEENVYVGLMFGSKALVQLLTNPWIGPLTNKIGYTIPMFGGFCIMFLSTVMFAFGTSFGTLWFARALQGVGSACTSTSGMGMLAQAYTDDMERGSAMGIALGGLALGVLVGPPYGGVLYQWSGKELPFLLLAMLALFDGSLQFFVLQPRVDRGEQEGTAMKELATDPYIVVAAGAITIGNLGIAMLEPSLPLWMMETWQAGSFERGAAFLPASISYLIGTNVFGPLAHKMGRFVSTIFEH
ncbi:unnamed protein product [Toxocara canis]|uniref:MFS domain-containing protein n=1 Tax=Toxocara canis TaxID=6265 RepID=A0A183TWI8_TOXCA|nr:unnamed protein product [Toxocara canis]